MAHHSAIIANWQKPAHRFAAQPLNGIKIGIGGWVFSTLAPHHADLCP
jgi:hypothetical protein